MKATGTETSAGAFPAARDAASNAVRAPISKRSGVGGTVHSAALPLSAAYRQVCGDNCELALNGDGFLGGGQGGLPLPHPGQPYTEVTQVTGQIGEVGVGVGLCQRAENLGHYPGEGRAEQRPADGEAGVGEGERGRLRGARLNGLHTRGRALVAERLLGPGYEARQVNIAANADRRR